MERPPPPALIAFLAPYPDEVVAIALRLRERVLAAMPRAHEFVWDATNAVALAYTPTTRWQDAVVHVASYSRHANLGFNDGATLPDSLGLLTGTGLRIRHVRFASAEEAGAPWIDDYLRAALAQAELSATMGDGGTTVRVSAGPKRRPPA